MGLIYDGKELLTKEDYILQLKEINAYRELDGEDFDFGVIHLINNMSFGSEDAYYEIDIQELEDAIEYWDYDRPLKKSKNKQRPNKHKRNQKHKAKMKKRADSDWWWYVWNDGYPKRYYRGKRSSHLKKQSSKKIRQHKGDFHPKGNKHKRVFDFWWELD